MPVTIRCAGGADVGNGGRLGGRVHYATSSRKPRGRGSRGEEIFTGLDSAPRGCLALWRGGPIQDGPKMNELHCGGTPVVQILTGRPRVLCLVGKEDPAAVSTLEPHVLLRTAGWPPVGKGTQCTGADGASADLLVGFVGVRGTQALVSGATPGGGGANFAQHSDR